MIFNFQTWHLWRSPRVLNSVLLFVVGSMVSKYCSSEYMYCMQLCLLTSRYLPWTFAFRRISAKKEERKFMVVQFKVNNNKLRTHIYTFTTLWNTNIEFFLRLERSIRKCQKVIFYYLFDWYQLHDSLTDFVKFYEFSPFCCCCCCFSMVVILRWSLWLQNMWQAVTVYLFKDFPVIDLYEKSYSKMLL